MSTATRVQSELAINVGEPIATQPFSPWPYFEEEEIAAAIGVLRSGKINYWTGEEGRQFEQEFAAFTQRKHGVAVANGTVALELALHALDIGPGDEVITASRTFIASASCAIMRGATPVIADIDRDSQNLTAQTVRPLITPRTKAIVAVHLAGWPCDMDPLLALAREYSLFLIEDCAQAHGATYKGCPVGSFGDIAAFSFCQDKILTTGGEGGMLLMDDEPWWERAWAFKDHGKSYDAVYRRQHPAGFKWLHESFGTNWRLTEMQSAMGRVLLRKLPAQVDKRRCNAAALDRCFAQIAALRVTVPPPEFRHSYYKYYVHVRPELILPGWDRDRIMQAIVAEGVPCFSGACGEIYLEKAFPETMRPPQRLPVARELGETSLLFLVHPTLTEEEITLTCRAVEKVFAACSRE
jgi:hypothetical protein